MRHENGRWTESSATEFDSMLVYSSDGNRIYFASEGDMWVAEKQGDNWSKARSLGITARFPDLNAIYMPSVTTTNTLSFIGYAPDAGNKFGIII